MIIQVPFYGCESTPDKVMSELHKYKFNELGKPLRFNSAKVENERGIYSKAGNVFNASEFSVFLGGGHAITLPIVKAFSEKNNNPGIIIFDAHPDCNVKFSTEQCEDLLLALVNKKIIRSENIILAGTRRFDTGEVDFLVRHNIKYYSMKEIISEGLHETCDAIMSAARNFGSLYISIDADVIDPAFVDVETPEPGGMTARELIYFLQRLRLLKNLKAADICEASDNKETIALAAKIVSELVY